MLEEYLQAHGYTLTKQTSTEWAGACPFCGGTDRLRVFADGGRDNGGHYWCRQCNASGDLISWKIDVEGLSFCEATGQTARSGTKREPKRNETRAKQVSAVSLSESWSAQAEHVLSSAWQGMKMPEAAEFFRDGRGLTGETCKALGFGWQEADSYFPPEMWGLPEGKKLAVPAGAVLPVRRGGRVVSLLVRRRFPYIIPSTGRELWFHEVRGGAKVPFLCGPIGAPLVVCESILCAASVYQASNGQVAALATLGAKKPIPDAEAVDFLKSASVVVIVADDDEAGGGLKKAVRQVRPDAEELTAARDDNGEPFLKANGKPAKDINDLLQVWRDDRRVFSWLAYGFVLAERRQAESKVSPYPAESSPCEPSSNASTLPECVALVEDEAGPDEFAAHVEQVRSAWPDGPPMIAQDMPDWRAFCAGYPDVCGQCPYYDGNPNGSPCALWEAAFPCVVTWYSLTF